MRADNVTVSQQPEEPELQRRMRIISLIIYCLIFIVGTVGNGLVIYVTGFKMKRTVNSVWFLNLALADFLFTAFLIFYIVTTSQAHEWKFGPVMCKLNTFVTGINMFASILLLMAISLDRCLSIWVVVWAHNQRTVRKAQLICVVIWVTAMVCSTPHAIFRNVQVNMGKTYCSYSASKSQLWSLGIFRFVIGFVLPFLVIFVSYVAISVLAKRRQRTRKARSHRIIVSIVLAFFFCWIPYHVVNFIESSTTNPEHRNIILALGPLAVSLAFMNSCLNPILYVFMCAEFQKKLKKSICLVLENALAEDPLSFMSSRSLSSQRSRLSRKSDSAVPVERKGTEASLNFTECKVNMTVEGETLNSE
ncbi:chemerin-like receptor 1 [Aulostomus maculatus]